MTKPLFKDNQAKKKKRLGGSSVALCAAAAAAKEEICARDAIEYSKQIAYSTLALNIRTRVRVYTTRRVDCLMGSLAQISIY